MKSSFEFDIVANRKAIKWTLRERLGRALWEYVGYPLFSLSPRPFWVWRRVLLRCFGAQVGSSVHIYPSVRIAVPWNLQLDDKCAIGDRAILYSLGSITIGASATVSQGAHLCAGTHDFRRYDMPLLKPPITIKDGAWICADAFVGPGVSVGLNAVVGARAVAIRDVADGAIVAGNPARQIGTR